MQITTETKVGMFVVIALGIFAYMLFHLGAFRLNVRKFRSYKTTFQDVSGLTEKADVKIAGVKVGWIESIDLNQDGALVDLMINCRYRVHRDAYAVIRQDGLLGARYIEMVSGSPEQPFLSPGATLKKQGEVPASMDSLMIQLKEITENVKLVTSSLSSAFGSEAQTCKMESFVNNLTQASERIAQVSEVLDRAVSTNEHNINDLMRDVCCLSQEMKTVVPEVKDKISHLGSRLDQDVFPAFQESIEKIAQVFDRDFGAVARKLETTANSIETLIHEARDGVKSVANVSSKVNKGKGLLGKLINDDAVYNDIKEVTTSFRQNVKKFDDLKVVVDAHGESMMRPVDNYCHRSNYGYLGFRLYTTPDWFYSARLVTSERGWPDRTYSHFSYLNSNCQCIDPNTIVIDDGTVKVAPNVESVCMKRNAARIDIQVGKIFHSGFTLRGGSFENTFGFALDYRLPIDSDILRWETGIEAYDFYGSNRLVCDRRPHLKWTNRLYLFNNVYFTFGADDFVSKCTKNGFWGFGLRFSDDDLKHVASKLGTFGTH